MWDWQGETQRNTGAEREVRMEHNILTLDFRQDSVAYEGNIMPTGTLGCEVLNIDDETIRTLESPCAVMGKLTEALGYGTADDDLLSEAKSAANQILDVLRNVTPFNRLDYDFYVPGITNAFTPEGLRQYRAYNLALLSGTLTTQQVDAFKTGILLARITMVFAQLTDSLLKFKEEIMPFAQAVDADESDRTPDGLSALFGRFFPPESPLTQDGTWMAFTNATIQYISAVYPNEETAKLVKRMHFVSFVGLFRSDLFEGLSIGHAPKRCRICGKWFLTTNARHTKYCGGFAPNDKYHRTCRQIGNLKGREQRELADDHPIRQIYVTRTNTINRYVKRGTLDADLARQMKKLAKDKMLRAISDVSYAQESYVREMEQDALAVEAKASLQ